MALLKTYSISSDITGGQVDLDKLNTEINTSGDVTNFDGLLRSGDSIQVYGDSFSNETGCDTTVQNHALPLMEPKGVRFEYLSSDLSTSDAGTYNGLSCLFSPTAILYDRWVFRSFDKNDINVATFEFILKDDYVAGSNIQVEVDWTTSTTSNQVHWHLGLCLPSATGDYGGESETTYIETDENAPATANWESLKFNTVFTASTCKAGDSLVVVAIREGSHTNDNMNGSAYIRGIKLIY